MGGISVAMAKSNSRRSIGDSERSRGNSLTASPTSVTAPPWPPVSPGGSGAVTPTFGPSGLPTNFRRQRRPSAVVRVKTRRPPRRRRSPSHRIVTKAQPAISKEDIMELRAKAEEAQHTNVVMELTLDDYTMQYLSPSWKEIIGTDPEDHIGAPISSMLATADGNIFEEATKRLLEDDSQTIEVIFRFWCEVDAMRAAANITNEEDDDFAGAGGSSGNASRELEGKGMLMYDAEGTPSHTLWVIHPHEHDSEAENLAAAAAAAAAATGTDGFEMDDLNDSTNAEAETDGPEESEYVEEDSIVSTTPLPSSVTSSMILQPPPPVLCHICEQHVSPIIFEQHSSLCVEVHRAEMEVQLVNDTLYELKKQIKEFFNKETAAKPPSDSTNDAAPAPNATSDNAASQSVSAKPEPPATATTTKQDNAPAPAPVEAPSMSRRSSVSSVNSSGSGLKGTSNVHPSFLSTARGIRAQIGRQKKMWGRLISLLRDDKSKLQQRQEQEQQQKQQQGQQGQTPPTPSIPPQPQPLAKLRGNHSLAHLSRLTGSNAAGSASASSLPMQQSSPSGHLRPHLGFHRSTTQTSLASPSTSHLPQNASPSGDATGTTRGTRFLRRHGRSASMRVGDELAAELIAEREIERQRRAEETRARQKENAIKYFIDTLEAAIALPMPDINVLWVGSQPETILSDDNASQSKKDQEMLIKLKHWHKPALTDPILERIANDVQKYVVSKATAVEKMQEVMERAEKARQEWDARLQREWEIACAYERERKMSIESSKKGGKGGERMGGRSGIVDIPTWRLGLNDEGRNTDTASLSDHTSLSSSPTIRVSGPRDASHATSGASASEHPMAVSRTATQEYRPSNALSSASNKEECDNDDGDQPSFRRKRVAANVTIPQRFVEMETIKSPLQSPRHLTRFWGQSPGQNAQDSLAPASPYFAPVTPVGRAPAPSIKDYEIIKPISKGAYGSVYLAKKRATGDYYAIKVLRKSDMIAKNQVTNVKAERMILMMQRDSPYVVRLFYSFQSKDYLYLVMEYLNGGDCASLIKTLGSLPEDWARSYLAEVTLGLEYLHNLGIIHR
jgi:PAS domain-containing protein